jgi:hypothetical protein
MEERLMQLAAEHRGNVVPDLLLQFFAFSNYHVLRTVLVFACYMCVAQDLGQAAKAGLTACYGTAARCRMFNVMFNVNSRLRNNHITTVGKMVVFIRWCLLIPAPDGVLCILCCGMVGAN